MGEPTPKSPETWELIRRFQTKRARRRKMYVLAACLGGIALIALVAAVLILAAPDGGQTPADRAVSSSVAATGPSTTASASSTAPLAGIDTTTGGSTTLPGVTPASSTTTSLAPVTASTASTTSTTVRSSGLVVVIDPGHQAQADTEHEPVGPGSTTMKDKVSSGTRSVNTGSPESALVLTVSLKLRDALLANGIQVVMTRTTQDVNISNSQRAQLANQAGADLFVRIHADGVSNSSVAGIHVLYPVSITGWTDDIAEESKQAATLALQELIAATGAKDRGLNPRDDMTGFNWSDVPVFLTEIGYMTNPAEDALLATSAYQDKIVQGLTQAILTYLGVS
jgi:N-acetylmuramoyl-L-alanine amidase